MSKVISEQEMNRRIQTASQREYEDDHLPEKERRKLVRDFLKTFGRPEDFPEGEYSFEQYWYIISS